MAEESGRSEKYQLRQTETAVRGCKRGKAKQQPLYHWWESGKRKKELKKCTV